ncbi:MAG: FG-GAP repeat domain-containing protein [Thermoguttaceae bacterium]
MHPFHLALDLRRALRRLAAPSLWKVLAGLGICLLGACLAYRAVPRSGNSAGPLSIPGGSVGERAIGPEAEAAIRRFCGDCHALPRPESFPRSRWHEEVRLGYEAYARSGRTDLTPPAMQDVVAYYRSRAPEQLAFPLPQAVDPQWRSAFRLEQLDWGQANYVLPAVSFLRWCSLGPELPPSLLVCDMRDGSVSSLELRGSERRRTMLAQLDHPCHIEPCDLDGNGLTDLVVAELGSYYPTDHDRGRVVWLRRGQAAGDFSPVTIAANLGRVADARPADVDGDGDTDLVVAEFGHFRTGNILLLRNVADTGEPPRFVNEEIDPRPGTIHVAIHDFNADRRPDFVALVSQEYEATDIFLNQGDGRFQLRNLWAGPDLTFGSSGIELTDLDQDGDMDILGTNGDAFDNSCASPSHGVRWLENTGNLQFACHRLADLPGAYRALPADLDHDGDLDVVAVIFLPPRVEPQSLRSPATASVVVLEQTSPGQFASHTLETGLPDHTTFETGDFDADGDIDLVVGTQLFPHGVTPGKATPPRLTVWWNQGLAAQR